MAEKHVMSVRLAEDVYEWLRREAFETREPMNTIVEAALIKYWSTESSQSPPGESR
jgi:hypothetical protein